MLISYKTSRYAGINTLTICGSALLAKGFIDKRVAAALPGRKMSLRQALNMSAITDAGRARDKNEDAVAVDVDCGVAILADGMGGYNAGEIASSMTITLLMQGLQAGLATIAAVEDSYALERLVRELVASVNVAVYDRACSQAQYEGMGTTLVLAVFRDSRVLVAHIGDSRLYRLRGGELTQLTRDHSLLQEQLDNGMLAPEDAPSSNNKNLVTRALGVETEVLLDINVFDAARGDMYLLCSDGLTDMVAESDIHAAMSLMGGNLSVAANELVALANEQGGRDNISVALVQVLKPYPTRLGFWQTIKRRISN